MIKPVSPITRVLDARRERSARFLAGPAPVREVKEFDCEDARLWALRDRLGLSLEACRALLAAMKGAL